MVKQHLNPLKQSGHYILPDLTGKQNPAFCTV